MLLTRTVFWYLPNPYFTRSLGDFGPKLDPDSSGGFFRFGGSRTGAQTHSRLGIISEMRRDGISHLVQAHELALGLVQRHYESFQHLRQHAVRRRLVSYGVHLD